MPQAQKTGRLRRYTPRTLGVVATVVIAVVGLVLALVVSGGSGGAGGHGSGHSRAAVSAADGSGTIPQAAYATLRKIEAGTWPESAHAPGTHGGEVWRNRDGSLPRSGPSGHALSYREWDVDPKRPGHSRDARRIVTGSDGSAWFTGDHYRTFQRMH